MQDQELQDKRSGRHLPVSIIAGLSTVVLVAGSATAWWTWNSLTSKNATDRVVSQPTVIAPADQPIKAQPHTTQASPQPSATVKTPVEQTVQVYWLKDTGTRLELAPSAISLGNATQPDERLKAAFTELLKGPTSESLDSTIPSGTTLLSLETKEDGIHVNLSKQFTSGGGSASMSGRLAQVIYTATTLDPTAKVWISVEGKPLTVLGGEGLMVDQPMTRADFDENFSL
ncbi:MAG TPA: GerMN domain-containing protein [Crinalium sp.]|jgi:spore germination protein GerM